MPPTSPLHRTLKRLFGLFKWLLFIVSGLGVLVFVFIWLAPTFGGKPDATSMAKIKQSAHYNGKKFVNLIPTKISTRTAQSPPISELLLSFLLPPKYKNPTAPLPSYRLDAQALKNGQFVWLGHSTVLFKTAGKVIISDPVFHRASPIPLGGAPFATTNPTTMQDLPFLDAVIISHDHYDHLDHLAIQALNAKVGHFYVPLGIKAHLQRWGVQDNKITELDWYQSAQLGEVRLTLTPARHFSGRGLFNRFSTLWGSWVIKSPTLSVYFSGDGGYSSEFANIGKRFGPFDIAFIEDGAYNQDWAEIHMQPEQSVQAAIDLNAQVLLPIHWSKFDLARHVWRDPIIRISKIAQARGVHLTTPIIGEIFTPQRHPQTPWWEKIAPQSTSN